MKEDIIKLRKLGYSYNEIAEKLGCSKSIISYHCSNYGLNQPIEKKNKISKSIIVDIINDKKNNSIIETANKYGLSVSTIRKYTKGFKISKKNISICLNCGKETDFRSNKQFCSSQCIGIYRHKIAYLDFITNNDKYCVGNYTAKRFKDFFLDEQDNKCAICKIEPIWNSEILIFVLDHIDGDASNNKRENLRLICPNCDSQTSTFKSKNKNSKRRNYWKEKITKNNDN